MTVSWSSGRQGCVSRSTMESKYIGLFNCACQFDWFSSLLQQLGYPLPNKQFILCDNQSAIHIANGAIMDFKRSRYMNVKYHWVCNQVKENDVLQVVYVPSEENTADIMTKRLNVRATLPPSTLFADRALLRRKYSISEPNALVETESQYKGLH